MDEIVPECIDFLEVVCLRFVQVQAFMRADYDPAVLHQALADNEVVGEIVVGDIPSKVRPETEQTVTVSRDPEFIVDKHYILDIDEWLTGVAIPRHFLGLYVEVVEHAILRSDP